MRGRFISVAIKNLNIGVAMFKDSNYYILNELYSMEDLKNIIIEDDIKACLADEKTIQVLKNHRIDCIFVTLEDKNFAFKLPKHLSWTAFGRLAHHLKHKGFRIKNNSKILGNISVFNICQYKSYNSFYLSKNILKEFKVFDKNRNPNEFIKTRREAPISLFSRINNTVTKLGEIRLIQWLQNPYKNRNCIEERHKHQDFLKNQIYYITRELKNVRISKITKNTPINLIENLLLTGIKLQKIFYPLKNITKYQNLLDLIQETIPNGYLRKGVDDEYDKCMKRVEKLPKFLDKMANKLAKKYDTTLSIVYFPQLGYLVESKKMLKKEIFKIKDKVYFKTEEMERLDTDIGDLKTFIQEKEVYYSSKIWEEIRKVEFYSIFNYLANLDALASLIIYSTKFSCIKPIFTNKKAIIIENYVSENININTPYQQSNNMKEVFQNVVLAQIGGFIPCKKASLFIFDNILTDTTKHNFYDILQCLNNICLEKTHLSLILLKCNWVEENDNEKLSIYGGVVKYLEECLIITENNNKMSL